MCPIGAPQTTSRSPIGRQSSYVIEVIRKFGGRTRARTWDPLIKSQLLYQLSYAPIESAKPGRCPGQQGRCSKPIRRCLARDDSLPCFYRLTDALLRGNPSWPQEPRVPHAPGATAGAATVGAGLGLGAARAGRDVRVGAGFATGVITTDTGLGTCSSVEPVAASTPIPITPPRSTLPAKPAAPAPASCVFTGTVCSS